MPKCPPNSLIPVRLICDKKGLINRFAIICLPKEKSDLKGAFAEKLVPDKYQQERKKAKETHRILLKKLRRQRRRKHVENKNVSEHANGLKLV